VGSREEALSRCKLPKNQIEVLSVGKGLQSKKYPIFRVLQADKTSKYQEIICTDAPYSQEIRDSLIFGVP